MQRAGANAAQLRVRHWRQLCLVPREHVAAERVRDRLADVVRQTLPAALATGLRPVLDTHSEELVFVRRLELDMALDTGADADAIAAACAQAFRRGLERELARDDPANVVRFRDPVAYLTRFLVDRAHGDAGSRWYYARFAGLSALSSSAALRTALTDDPVFGLAALRALTPLELAAVIDAAGESECRRVLDAIAATLPEGDFAQACARLIPGAQDPLPSGVGSAAQLGVWWLARSVVAPDRAFLAAALTFARAVVALRGSESGALRRALADDDVGSIAALAAAERDIVLALRACPRALRQRLLAPTDAAVRTLDAFGSTPFGAGFVLLNDVFALPIERMTRGWPALRGVPAANLLRWLVLLRCAGAACRDVAFADPVWRRVFGVAPGLDRACIDAWLAALGPRCRRRFARGLARFEHGPCVRVDVVQIAPRRQLRVQRDADGAWCGVEPLPSPAADVEQDAASDTTAADVAHLLAPQEYAPRAWPVLLAWGAQRVLCRFLQRLPGFARSHLAYAQRNLLAFGASVEAEDARIVVRLGGPPLALLLNIAGVNRGQRDWPALDARPFALFAGD